MTSWSAMNKFQKFGVVSEGFGLVGGLIGNIFAADEKKYKLRSQALEFEHRSTMARLNAKALDRQSQHVKKQYDKQMMIKSMQYGQAFGKDTASFAARGGAIGYGSTRDVQVSKEVMKEIDLLTMNVNKVKAAGNIKMQGVDQSINAELYGVSAGNMFASANMVSPWMNMSSTLMTGAGSLASKFA
tara:strand:- start:14671 stop:15228 length:558 start_codon:yes stop_codon:yes gene_type:complete